MLNQILKQFQGDNLKAHLMRGGLTSISIKVLGLGFSLLTVIVLARALGPEQYGIYSYVLAIASLLAFPAQFGLPSLIVRETAKAEVKQDWGLMNGLWHWCNSITASISLLIALGCALWLWLNRGDFTEIQLLTFAWGVVFIPLSALAALRGASLQGLRKVIQGQLPEHIFKPVVFIILLVVIALTGIMQLTAANAMMLNVVSAGIAFLFGAWLLWQAKPVQLRQAVKTYKTKAWVSSVIPFAMLSGLAVVTTQTDIIMLGLLKGAAEVGIYKVAAQGAALAALGIMAANTVTMPYMSRFSNNHDILGLQKIMRESARLSLLVAVVVAAVFLTLGDTIIIKVFGHAYADTYVPLLLLILGQVIHAGMGAGGTLLNMCGHEKGTLITLLLSASLNVLLNFWLIPLWGIDGAVTATLIAIAFRKIVMWIIVYRTLGIDSSALGLNLRINKKV